MFEKLKKLLGFSGKVEDHKPAKKIVVIPPVDDDMYRLMELGSLWPQESEAQRKEQHALIERGVHKKVDEYFKAKEASGILMTDLTGLEYDYYWNG